MTVLFKNLRTIAYGFVLLLAGSVLGIASYFASHFLPHIRPAFTAYSLVAPSITVIVLTILLFGSRPWIDAIFLLIMSISWLALAAWASDINGPADCYALGSSKTPTSHGKISSKGFCYESKILEAFSWSIFGLRLPIFLDVCDHLANRDWYDDIDELPWFGEYPGYPGVSMYPTYQGVPNPAPTAVAGPLPTTESEGVIQHQPGHSIIIWPGVNGNRPRIEQRPGIVTQSTLSL
ncbi:hypothetical protein BGW80DRAFT_1285099 [Lactifluus volemus]|nr:hypothetical protein BGW80DRAFT_1285099 [Lactifluus volemus]